MNAVDMTKDQLAVALWRAAAGNNAQEAAVGLLIATEAWLSRADLRRYVALDTDPYGEVCATVDWWRVWKDAGRPGRLPCTFGEQQVLACAASLMGVGNTTLHFLLTGLGDMRMRHVLDAVTHAAGWHEDGAGVYVAGELGDAVAAVAGRCAS